MLSITHQSSQIAWLKARLASRRNRILGLICRLTGLGPAVALKPPLFMKFSFWLDEVAAAKREEDELLARIEAVEQTHRFLRTHKQLRRAGPLADAPFDEKPKAKRPFIGLFGFIVLWYLCMRQKINQKKQGLTVD